MEIKSWLEKDHCIASFAIYETTKTDKIHLYHCINNHYLMVMIRLNNIYK